MTNADELTWEQALIADMREHEGRPTSGPLAGHPLMLMQGRGAKTGEPRHAVLTYTRDGEDYVVAGTAGGSTKAPAWVANMRAHPDLTLEIGHRLCSLHARRSSRTRPSGSACGTPTSRRSRGSRTTPRRPSGRSR